MKLSLRSSRLNFDLDLGRQKQKPPRLSEEQRIEPARSQTRDALSSPFTTAFNSYQPFQHNIGLFRTIREAIPFVNIAIQKKVKLIGWADFETYGDKKLKEKLTAFKDEVQVNWFSRGLMTMISELAGSAFETGMGFGEIVPTKSYTDIYRLKTCRTEDFRFALHKGELVIATFDNNEFQAVPVEYQDLVTFLAFDQRDGHPMGYSALYSLPFVSQILLRMEKSWENATWRAGDPTYVTIVTGGDNQSPAEVKQISDAIGDQVKNVMALRRQGQTADIHGGVPYGGKVEIRALGADTSMTIAEISVRTILEQIISELDLPPSMLGVSWATTERMSKDQNDMLVSSIKWERYRLNSIIRQIIDIYLIMTGDAGKRYDVTWTDVNLLDETEQAKARLFNAQANEKTIANVAMMIEYGWQDEAEASDYLRREGIIAGKMPSGWWKSMRGIQFAKKMATELLT